MMEYRCNYFIGNDPPRWRTDVPNYEVVTLRNIYDGVDLKFYGRSDGRLMYEYAVGAGADVEQIRLEYKGSGEVSRIRISRPSRLCGRNQHETTLPQ